MGLELRRGLRPRRARLAERRLPRRRQPPRGRPRRPRGKYADEQVTTGAEAEAYASFIGGHLEGIADGKTYAEIDDRGAAQAVVDARESGASEAEIAELQATATELKAQRDSLFRGETLRGLLLSSYAWATVGAIAGIAAYVAFAGAAVLLVLVVAGVIHLRRMTA